MQFSESLLALNAVAAMDTIKMAPAGVDGGYMKVEGRSI